MPCAVRISSVRLNATLRKSASATRRLLTETQGTSDQVWREQIAVKDRSIQGTNYT